MYTSTIKPVKRDIQYLSESQYDRDLYTNAKYIKDSIDYNDNPFSSWLGNSSVELKQIENILRSYVQLVITNQIKEYFPNGYPGESIEKIGAGAAQDSNITLRAIKVMYWGVKQNRITTTAILYPKLKQSDPNYKIPEEPGFIERMSKNVAETTEGIVNKVGSLATGTLDAAGAIIDTTKETTEGLGVLGKYGVPVIIAGAASAVVYFMYNIARTSSADKVIKVVDKMPSKQALSDKPKKGSRRK